MKKFSTACAILSLFLIAVVVLVYSFSRETLDASVLISALVFALVVGLIGALTQVYRVFAHFGLGVYTTKIWENSSPRGPYHISVFLISIAMLTLSLKYRGLGLIIGATCLSLGFYIVPSWVRLTRLGECHTRTIIGDWINIVFGVLLIVAGLVAGVFYD